MKKLTLSFIFVIIFALSSFAQTTEHLKFKGVPIDGTLSEYIAKMNQAGFQLVETDDGEALLEGEFAGYRDCMVGVKTLQKQDLVYEVSVIFPMQNEWSGLNDNYESLKLMLSQKYGEPIECVEEITFLKEKTKDEINKIMMNDIAFFITSECVLGIVFLRL